MAFNWQSSKYDLLVSRCCALRRLSTSLTAFMMSDLVMFAIYIDPPPNCRCGLSMVSSSSPRGSRSEHVGAGVLDSVEILLHHPQFILTRFLVGNQRPLLPAPNERTHAGVRSPLEMCTGHVLSCCIVQASPDDSSCSDLLSHLSRATISKFDPSTMRSSM